MRPEWKITPLGCIIFAAALLILPLRFLLAAAAAAAIHEGCHYAAIRLCGGKVYAVRMGVGKTVIEAQPLEGLRGLLCAGAGPAGSLALLALARRFPLLALCGMAQGLYNLLPIYPMDGGRMMRCAMESVAVQRGIEIADAVERVAGAGVVMLAIYGAIRLRCAAMVLFAAPIATANAVSVKNTLQRIARKGTIEKD